jgi:hypothetical protein
VKVSDSISALLATSVRMEQSTIAHARSKPDRGDLIARAAFARLGVVALAVAMGCVFALGLWFATAMLLMKDTPPGVPIGPHLALLSNFLPGYTVSWSGSLLGAFYAFTIGCGFGAIVAAVWNVAHHI